jgi:flagellar protein FliO/FliZ
MLGLSESFFASKSTTLFAAALAFLAAAVLLSVIFRFAFGRRVRLPRNGRARLPRLGTVDAFDLDRQRQLVIIRRDNVEHLLMIGGPNDLVIESQIIRAESRDPREFRDARICDKESREKEPRDAPPLPAGVSWPSPAESPSPPPPPRKVPFPPAAVLEPELGAMGAVPAEESLPGFGPSTVLPSPRPPAFPLPPRRASPVAAPSGQRLPNQRESLYGRGESSQRPEPVAGPDKELRRASVATPFLRSSTQRQAEGTAAVRLAPSSSPEAPPAPPLAPNPSAGFGCAPGTPELNGGGGTGPAPAAPAALPVAPAVGAGDVIHEVPATAPAQAGIETLEAEMAKLLGRGPG